MPLLSGLKPKVFTFWFVEYRVDCLRFLNSLIYCIWLFVCLHDWNIDMFAWLKYCYVAGRHMEWELVASWSPTAGGKGGLTSHTRSLILVTNGRSHLLVLLTLKALSSRRCKQIVPNLPCQPQLMLLFFDTNSDKFFYITTVVLKPNSLTLLSESVLEFS